MPLTLVPPRKGRSRFWRLRGTVRGVRIDETTGVESRELAEAVRIKREAQILEESIFGARVSRTFSEAAVSYIETIQPGRTQVEAIIGRQRRDGQLSPVVQGGARQYQRDPRPDRGCARSRHWRDDF